MGVTKTKIVFSQRTTHTSSSTTHKTAPALHSYSASQALVVSFLRNHGHEEVPEKGLALSTAHGCVRSGGHLLICSPF